MRRIHVYADESGDFDFSAKGSRYFILTTVVVSNHRVADDLLALRRQLTWDGFELRREFHATQDQQIVRDHVFQTIAPYDFRIDATILNKRKTQLHIRRTEERFYQTAWFYHMKHVVPLISQQGDELLVIAASIGTKAKREAFHSGIRDVMTQVCPGRTFKTAFWPAATDPCLQVADYASWAIQRKWENADERSYVLIKDKIVSEFDLFWPGKTEYY